MRNKKIKARRCGSRKSYEKRLARRRADGILSSLTSGFRRVASHIKNNGGVLGALKKGIKRLNRLGNKPKVEMLEMQEFAARPSSIDYTTPKDSRDIFKSKRSESKSSQSNDDYIIPDHRDRLKKPTPFTKNDVYNKVYLGYGKKIRL